MEEEKIIAIINKAAIEAKNKKIYFTEFFPQPTEIWLGTLGSEGTWDCNVYVPLDYPTIIKHKYLFTEHGLYCKDVMCVSEKLREQKENENYAQWLDDGYKRYYYVILRKSWFPYIRTLFGSL